MRVEKNLTPSDVYFGRDKRILKQRETIQRKTLETRRLNHIQHAALCITIDEPKSFYFRMPLDLKNVYHRHHQQDTWGVRCDSLVLAIYKRLTDFRPTTVLTIFLWVRKI